MENNTKQCDTSMYKTLCVCSPEFEKIPINRRNLGIAGDIAPYGVMRSKV